MTGTVEEAISLFRLHGSTVRYHRDSSVVPCPCRTPEGFRDPAWHLQNPAEPVCNEAGMLPDPDTTADFNVKGFVQPIQSTRATRLSSEAIQSLFGEVQADDHLAILPVEWDGQLLDFYHWGQATEDYIGYNGRKFQVVNANLIPDPADGNPWHHWELGIRRISDG